MNSTERINENRTLCTSVNDVLNSNEFISGLETILRLRKKYQISHILGIFRTLLQKNGSTKLSDSDKSDLLIFLNDPKIEELRYEFMGNYKKLSKPTLGTYEEISNWVSFINSLESGGFDVIKDQLIKILRTNNNQESHKTKTKKVTVKVGQKVEIKKTGPRVTIIEGDEFSNVKENHIRHVCSINSEAIMKLKTGKLPIDFYDYPLVFSEKQKDNMKIVNQSDIVIDNINSMEIEGIRIYIVRFTVHGVEYLSVSIPEEMNSFNLSETIRGKNKRNLLGDRTFNDKYLKSKVSEKFNGWLTIRMDGLQTKEKDTLLYLANEVLSSGLLHDSNFAIILLSEIMIGYLGEEHKMLLEKLLNGVTSLVEEDLKLLKVQRQVFGVSMEDILFRMVPYLNNGDKDGKNKSIMFNINIVNN